jgi:site-specific recombinase XerD
MKDKLISDIQIAMAESINAKQMEKLTTVLNRCLQSVSIAKSENCKEEQIRENSRLLATFISSKRVEGCSEKTLKYYASTIESALVDIGKCISDISTNDLRCYLANYQASKKSSKVTIDNIRRIFSSFFSWLEDEDYIVKSPVRRIHKVKTGKVVKEILSDENLETLRDSCLELRDLAMIDLLVSTGMRVGELVGINRVDIDFHERECVVFGKGGSEREVYFDARTKIHLKQYLESRTDNNPALFVSLAKPHNRLKIGGVEMRLREIGRRVNIAKVHPHKFRRTLATMAIGKGVPIEQVQKLLGHVKIDTTMHYAMVSQNNVKISHRKYIS